MQPLETLSANARAVRVAELHDAGVTVLTGDAYRAMIAACDAVPTEADIDAAIAELRAAGFVDPCVMPRPSTAQAIAYVRDYFDQREYDSHATICGCVPSREADHARDVLFVMDGDPRPARFTVWFEPVAPRGFALYGEW